ncbi:hypothetical protein FS837_007078 [Tulasnella sp. UAMH 9824]|nr:hypothetical protein FS837_007078 [Tulasnella sp. UAMH 9824]
MDLLTGRYLIVIQEIPVEVMSMIFAMLDTEYCAVAALVCRLWSGVALDELWRSPPSLLPLFEILGPLIDTENGKDLRSDVVLTARSWALFKSYAARVRRLNYEDNESYPFMSTGLILRALAVHPEGGILPNLRAAYWRVNELGLNHTLAFCPPTLERMSLQVTSEYASVESVERLLSCLSSSLQNRLKFFEFGTTFQPTQDATLSTALKTFLKNQCGLLGLKLPFYPIQEHAAIFETCHAAPQLRTFCGEVLDFTKEMLREAFSELARKGASLRCIGLSRSGAGFGEETIRLADVEPLLQLSAIEDIRLWFECNLELEVRDIQQMGQAWKGLTSLFLYSSEGQGIPIARLVAFAEWFPALQRFAADFDCSKYIPTAYEVPCRFKRLRRLILLGVWIADDATSRIAEFLAMVCGPNVNVAVGLYGLDSFEIFDEEWDWMIGDYAHEVGGIRERMDAFYRAQEGIQRMY